MSKQEFQPKDLAGKLAKAFLHNPLTPLLGVFLLVIGYFALEFTPREEDPQMEISGGSIIVALPGATPKEIENVIVKPLERKIREIKGVEYIYGMAMNDMGVVNVSYYIGEDREESNLKLYDKVMQNMNMLPKGTMQPLVKPFDIDIDVPILSAAFYTKEGSKLTQPELFNEIRKMQHEINRIDNVARTELKGEKKHQFNIEVDMHKLSGHHLSLGQIAQALQSLAINVPDIDTDTKSGRLAVFGVKNAIESKKDIENVIIAVYHGSPVYLKDVATVSMGENFQNFKETQISFKDQSGEFTPLQQQVTMTVSKLKGTNAVFIAENFKAKLNEFKPRLDELGVGYVITRNYGQRADDSVNRLVSNLLISIVIVVGLLVFVLGWKESLIVAFTVPAIFAVTLFIAYMTDQTVNRITLFAFMVSLGMLVDAAIIVVENIHRHMHEHGAADKSSDQIVLEATDEIGPATNVATVAIILTMIPMAFVGQMMGQFMKPIPLNVPVALFASLIVAYIFAPYMAKRMMRKPKHKHGHSAEANEGGAK